jgi:hypothetical protein
MISTRCLLASATLILAMPLAARAQSPSDAPPPSDQGGRHPGPPPEAIAACKGKAVGTQASFVDRGGRSVSGACTQMGDVLAVPPPRRSPGEHGGPPAQQK